MFARRSLLFDVQVFSCCAGSAHLQCLRAEVQDSRLNVSSVLSLLRSNLIWEGRGYLVE